MDRKVAIMQPYLFPYLGYFQLIRSANHFVLYDDVNYIKQGWVNRNNILNAGKSSMFTVPLRKASSFQMINEVQIDRNLYSKWLKKFNKSIEQSYSKAPYYFEVKSLIDEVFGVQTSSISELASTSIIKAIEYLGIEVELFESSKSFSETKGLNRELRIIEICKALNCNHYINAANGVELYDKEGFKKQGMKLSFIQNNIKPYQQFKGDFIPSLSIIDLMMFNSKRELNIMIDDFNLV